MLAAILIALITGVPVSYSTYVIKPISAIEIWPITSINATPSNRIALHACKDQYQSASFVIRAEQNLTNFLATPGDLSDGPNTIPASAVDIRVVKCWYQSGQRESSIRQPGRYLRAELLLKDDGLVRVDTTAQQNYLRLAGGGELCISGDTQATPGLIQPTDAVTLQPVSILAHTNKQFWVTLHVPSNTVAGTYKGRITLTADGAQPNYIDLELLVHPFTLEQPHLIYSLIYNGSWNGSVPGGTIKHAWKSLVQYTAEMTNLLQHGVRYPGFSQYWGDPACDPEPTLTIRDNLGFPKEYIFYYSGMGATPPITQAQLDAWRLKVRTIKATSEKHGYATVYCFGVDEAPTPVMLQEIPAFKITREEGCYNFITTNAGYHPFENVGNYVDVADYHGEPNAAEAAKWHSVGAKIFNYSNPQTYNENPYVYRRNYGWLLFKNNYDGTFLCAYQANYGQHIWNDFAGIIKEFRGQNLTYPTTNGVIDTVQYEGFREGINDMRYLATLQKAIRDYGGSKPALAAAAQAWINRVNPNDDLDALRLKMVDWINQLTQ